MSVLSTPLDRLPGVTPNRRALLAKLDLSTVGDLLRHFPRGYEDLSEVRAIADLQPDQPQMVQGEVIEMETREISGGRFVLSVVLTDDGRNILEGVWFNQAFMARRFRYGQRVSFAGKPKWYRDHWQISNPKVQGIDGEDPVSPGIVPIYPLTEDLRPDVLRQLIGKALELHGSAWPERLPAHLRDKHGWPVALDALREMHFPSSLQAARQARLRFIYEELLILQLALALRRRELRDRQKAPILENSPRIDERIRALFPFSLTPDQDEAIAEITRDLASPRPMQRLLQADVGAGKTAVAVYAMLVAVACKHQAVLMAPTEVLARQHAQTLEGYLANSRVRRLLLTGGMPARQRRDALEALKSGEIDLVVGTQALVQEGVSFSRLGLVVVDEQHKFGVHQRARVRQLGGEVHYLIMTATPIPRTMALTVFGDLDVSLIRQLPPGRQPVVTRQVREDRRAALYEQIGDALRQGQQAYVVCPLVEESEKLEVVSAQQAYQDLAGGPLRDFRLGLLHGRMDETEKAEVMRQFRSRELDVLVCTTVIEVGVDVPNATWMVIEHAERFGLSQLHQLRGRVSRGREAGRCFLFAETASEESRDRLEVFMRTTDGFELAEEDVRLRGMGELFGARQHGAGELGWMGLPSMDILQRARTDAFEMVRNDPGLRQPDHALLRGAILERYGGTLELAEVG